MKNTLTAFGFAIFALCALPASAKSETVKLEIRGPTLNTPLEIIEEAVLERFSIWNGPGVTVNGEPVHLDAAAQARSRSVIDWPRGAAASPPPAAQRYEVIFHQGGRESMHEWHRRYVVIYAFDPSTSGGYIYLPGKGDGENYRRNTFSIHHGVEGNWFHASAAWEALVRPRIASAATVSSEGVSGE